MNNEQIIAEYGRYIITRLIDKGEVEIGSMGQFELHFKPEYIIEQDNERVMYPPTINVLFSPSPYLRDLNHYTTLSFNEPKWYVVPEHVRSLSELLDLSTERVQTVLDEHLKEILTALFRGKRVELLSMGELYVVDEGTGLLMLNYVVSEELASIANRPFSAYQPEPLKTGIDFPEIEHCHSPDERSGASMVQQTIITQQASETVPSTEEITSEEERQEEVLIEEPVTVAPEAVPTVLPMADMAEFTTAEEEKVQASEEKRDKKTSPKDNSTPIQKEEKKEKKHHSRKIALLLFLMTIVILGLFMLYKMMSNEIQSPPTIPQNTPNIIEPTPKDSTIISTDTVAQPAPEVNTVMDTIRIKRGDSLNKYAWKYYGYKRYWVYIYMANDSIIKDPDNIPIGTLLTIPTLTPYDLDPDTEIAHREARYWESLILSGRYQNYTEQRQIIRERMAMSE